MSGDLTPGSRARPDASGLAERGMGNLKSVSDVFEGFAMFVYVSQLPTLFFRAPSEGILPGVPEQCVVISYSDGSTVNPGEEARVRNWQSEAVCETGNNRGIANWHIDEWLFEVEDRVCEEE